MEHVFSAFRRRTAIVLLAVLVTAPHAAVAAAPEPTGEATTYILWYRNYDSPAVRTLLRIALQKTPEYGDYRIRRSQEMVQGRALLELQRKGERLLTVINVATSPERERNLYEIPIPIDGGLLGFRVCLVRKAEVEHFAGIQSLDDFSDRGLTIGQGAHWPDAEVLMANGIPVVTHTRFESLFDMLKRGRFDCFARGVSEVLYDLDMVDHHDLVVEPTLLLAYPMPSYFFVGPDDHVTAQRIRLGLDRAIADGTFAIYLAMFYGRAIELLDLEQRTMLKLENPYLNDDPDSLGRRIFENLRNRIAQGAEQQRD